MSPDIFIRDFLDPGLAMLARVTGLASDDRARVMLLAIAGQESNWDARRQAGGPARGHYQFERGGGVRGVLNHPATAARMEALCRFLCVPTDEATVYEAIAWNDPLAVGMARLLLWSDPKPLPAVGAQDAALAYYEGIWRPGKPDASRWALRYPAALQAIQAAA